MWARAFGGNWSNLYMNVTFPLWGKVKCFRTREILVGCYSLDLGETWRNSIGGLWTLSEFWWTRWMQCRLNIVVLLLAYLLRPALSAFVRFKYY